MTAKQRLWAHIREMHGKNHQPKASATLAELQRWHKREHWRNWCNHHHGPTSGPGDRPTGWATGEDAVMKETRI